MKMKYLFAVLVTATALLTTSCGNDDHPIIPAMKKVTRISCVKEADKSSWNMKIDYNREGKLYRMEYTSTPAPVSSVVAESFYDLYQYGGNKITVIRFIGRVPDVNRTYTCSGDVITKEEEEQISANVNNTYDYRYQGKELISIMQSLTNSVTGNKPTEIPYEFTWKNGNMTDFTYNKTTRLEFTYETLLHPENFPLKAVKTVDLTDKNFLNPINLYFHSPSHFLPVSAKEIEVLSGKTKVTYVFEYKLIGDYITGMTMTVDNLVSGVTSTYTYSFEYNFDPNAVE